MVRPGEWYTDGHRMHKVVKVAGGVVTYEDVYQKGYATRVAARRESSLIEWDLDVEAGRLRRVAKAE